MFAYDTDLLLSNKNVNKLSNDMNVELQKMSISFKVNKLSIFNKNEVNTFHSEKKIRFIANDLPILYINNFETIRESVAKLLGIYIYENLTWKYDIKHVCNKVSKSMYNSRNFLSKKLMKQPYFSFIHNYLYFTNIA